MPLVNIFRGKMLIDDSESFWSIIDGEFVCWFCPKKSVKMPLELPTSDTLPVSLQHSLSNVSAQPSTSTSSVSTLAIDKDKVLTSVCDTLLSNPASSQSDTIDLVVVSSEGVRHAGQLITSTTTTSTMVTTSSCQYKLSEMVSRDKDLLFQKSGNSDLELEPARQSVFSVRHRNRQFFTVTEEEENESDGDGHSSSVDKVETVTVNPVFNLGDSLKRLYFPEQHKHRKRERKVRTYKKRPGSGDSHGYESDPEGKMGFSDIVKNDPDLKSYKSHPELNLTETVPVEEAVGVFQSKSLPNTPRVSPKLMRRNSLSSSNQSEVQKTSPGYSFLASVAGELHLKRKKHEKGIMRASEDSGSVAVAASSASPQVAQPQTVTTVENTEPRKNIHTHHFNDFSDSASVDEESHGPISFSSLIKWGTSKKIKVTNKESNMFSPSSF